MSKIAEMGGSYGPLALAALADAAPKPGPRLTPEAVIQWAETEAGVAPDRPSAVPPYRAGFEPSRPDSPAHDWMAPPWANWGQPPAPQAPPPEAEAPPRPHFDAMDDETRAAYVFSRYFEAVFDDTKFDNGSERIAEVAGGERAQEIHDRLSESGLSDDATETIYNDIVAAARFYQGDDAARDALDAGNDDDGGADDVLDFRDADARFMALTADSDNHRALERREAIIESFAGREHDYPYAPEAIEQAFTGETRLLGPLGSDERELVVEHYVDVLSDTLMDTDDPLDANFRSQLFLPGIEGDEPFHAALREAYAEEAIELQIGMPGDPVAEPVAAAFAGHALLGLDGRESAALVRSLDGTVEIDAQTAISEAEAFAASLMLPPDLKLDGTYAINESAVKDRVRFGLVVDTLAAMNDQAGNGGVFTRPEYDFVLGTFNNAAANAYAPTPAGYGEQQDSRLPAVMAEALVIASYGGDADAQSLHRERLQQVLENPDATALVARNEVLDPATHKQLTTTLLLGRYDASGRLTFWTADDFDGDKLDGVAGDVIVDNARRMRSELGESELTVQQEQNLRAIEATGQGWDLFGLNSDTNHSLRTQFTHMVLENGWTAEDFGDGNGWDNALVNGEYLVRLVEREYLGQPPDESALATIREIGESEPGRHVIGLDAEIDDAGRMRYLQATLDRGWTVETYGLTDDPALNTEFSFGLAEPHIESLAPGTEKYESLDRLATGEAEAFVREALSTPKGADEVIRPIADRIDEFRGGNSRLRVIPLSVNTGEQQVDLMLFEIRDGNEVNYVDLNAQHYADAHDWWKHNKLPPGRVAFTGTSDEMISDAEFVSPHADPDVGMVSVTTKAYPDTWWERHGGKIVTGVALVGGTLVIIGSAGTASPVVAAAGATGTFSAIGTTGAVFVGTAGAYQLGSGGLELYQHAQHGGSLNPADPLARGAYLNIAEGTLTLATAGSGAIAFKGGRLAARLPSIAGLNRGMTFVHRADAGISLVGNSHGVHQILTSDLSGAEKVRLLAQMGVYGAVDFGAPIAINRTFRGGRPGGDVFNARATGINPDLTPAEIARAMGESPSTPGLLAMDPLVRTDAANNVLGGRNTNGPAVGVARVVVDGELLPPVIEYNLVNGDGWPMVRLTATQRGGTNIISTPRGEYAIDLSEYVQRYSVDLNGELRFIEGPPGAQGRPQRIQQEFVTITDVDGYMFELRRLYEASGTPLTYDVERAIKDYIYTERRLPIYHIDQDTGMPSNAHDFPGTHAEVVALNRAVAEARAQDHGVLHADIAAATVHNLSGGRGTDFAACRHCHGILDPDIVHIVTG